MRRQPTLFSLFCVVVLASCSVSGFADERQKTAKTAGPKASLRDLGGVQLRYPGVRWTLLYGSYEGVEQFAVNELQRMVQRNLPYVLEILPASRTPDAERNLILVGTSATHPKIAELGQKGLVKLPRHAQGYTIACLKSPWQARARLIVVAGTDPSGVLYGVEEFNKKLAALFTRDLQPGGELRAHFDALPEFSLTEAPVIENRGVWTWGYVIYDYRRFLDNMARLKMNRLTVWNDVPPVNCRQVIEYAHARGIKVILGYSWGYALSKLDPTNPEHRRLVKDDVLKNYEDRYKTLGMDGIYFQNFTEQDNTMIGGKSIAGLACEWVNDMARALLEKQPALRLEYGVSGTSIRENYGDLKSLDPRVAIVWEDAGGMPYSYDPEAPASAVKAVQDATVPNAEIEYSKKLAALRSGGEFAMCAKGWIQLRWPTESEPHGSFLLGERTHEFIVDRLRQRQPRWDYVNAKWMANYPVAMRFYREVRETTSAPMTVVGLIEDGLFEEQIQPSVSLLGEMLWNPNRSEKEVLDAAFSPYYRIVE
jgi:hypothetical protein